MRSSKEAGGISGSSSWILHRPAPKFFVMLLCCVDVS
jgi:hypothetical protein